MAYWVGTSGWSYRQWQGTFYPRSIRAQDWLGHYAEVFDTVELNASFYRLPSLALMASIADRTPAGFLVAVKAWRRISHWQRLQECREPLAQVLERIEPLGAKAGPILVQLPPHFPVEPERLEAFLEILPEDRRFALEFRDPSWHEPAVFALLQRHHAAFVPFELGALRSPRQVTAEFVYVRLHGRAGRYRGAYSEQALRSWAGWLEGQMAEGRDAYVYFDNTEEGIDAVRDAMRLRDLLAGQSRGR